MLRFIIKRRFKDGICGVELEDFETLDCDAPDLERALIAGGYGPNGYDIRILVGVEVLPAPTGGEHG